MDAGHVVGGAWAYAEGNYHGARGAALAAALAAELAATRAMSPRESEAYMMIEFSSGLNYAAGPPPWELWPSAATGRPTS